MSTERANTSINNTIILRNNFQFSQTGDYFDPYSITKVEILDSDQVTVIETITGADIIKDETGKYHVVATAIATPKTIYDKWTFVPAAGAATITKTNACIVWETNPDAMTALSSTIDICNLALAHIGQNPITSLTDENNSARTLNRIFNISKDVVLRAKDWGFAKVKATLSELDQDIPGWGYVYLYPPRCLCIRKVFIDTETYNPAGVEYEVLFVPEINQKVIVCNYESAYIDYTYQLTDTTLFDKAFVIALSFLLAAQIAKPLTGDDEIAKTMLQIYGSLVSDAARMNDIEKKINPVQTSSFEEAR